MILKLTLERDPQDADAEDHPIICRLQVDLKRVVSVVREQVATRRAVTSR